LTTEYSLPAHLKKAYDVFQDIKNLYDAYKLARSGIKKIIEIIKSETEKRRKILLIGGGEIGTEIGIAAYNTKRWYIRAIIQEKPSPIMFLPFYAENLHGLRIEDFEIIALNEDPLLDFQFRYLPSLRGYEAVKDIKELIIRMKPDIVLLEDMFMTPEEWNDLCQLTLEDPSLEKKPLFMPSPTHTIDKLKDISNRYSDVFLSKIIMKKFLSTIGLEDHVLGSEYDKELEKLEINIEELKSELSHGLGKEYGKIRDALSRYKKIVLKPESTSSGHGQFILSSTSQLTPAYLDEQIKLVRDHRIPNKRYLIERYLKNRTETCVIIAETKEGSIGLHSIYYEKYDMEEFNKGGFQGQTRLLCSESRKEISQILLRLVPDIIKKIRENLLVPFLYIELLIDGESSKAHGDPKIYINEISCRPDDAGFITLISHGKDQFGLFIESLENLFYGKERNRQTVYLEPEDNWICKTLILCEKFKFDEDYLKYETDSGRIQDHFKFKFYVKALGEEIYRRIIGYQWHHKAQEDEDQGMHILTMHKSDLGLSEESLRQLTDYLRMSKPKR